MLYWICLAVVVLPMVVERLLVRRWRARIPLLVHVHGTRGKSSTVRDCARLLREQGLNVLAKTTGDAPEYVLPDGSVKAIRRIGPPRIQEHVAILRKAARLRVDAVVVEGMALSAETVWQSERILRATHAVITNTRPDHAECMGSGRSGVAATLGLMIPENGELFTAAEEGVEQLAEISRRKNCSIRIVKSFSSLHQPGCLANAVAAAALAESPTATAESSPAAEEGDRVPPYQKSELDLNSERPVDCRRVARRFCKATCVTSSCAGPMWVESISNGVPVWFLDLFSINDVETTGLFWKKQRRDPAWLRVALLATRADRPLRTRDLLEWLLTEKDFDVLLPQGGHAGYVWLRAGTDRRTMRINPWTDPGRVLEKLGAEVGARGKRGVELIGLANYHGIGEKWRNLLTGGNRCLLHPLP